MLTCRGAAWLRAVPCTSAVSSQHTSRSHSCRGTAVGEVAQVIALRHVLVVPSWGCPVVPQQAFPPALTDSPGASGWALEQMRTKSLLECEPRTDCSMWFKIPRPGLLIFFLLMSTTRPHNQLLECWPRAAKCSRRSSWGSGEGLSRCSCDPQARRRPSRPSHIRKEQEAVTFGVQGLPGPGKPC